MVDTFNTPSEPGVVDAPAKKGLGAYTATTSGRIVIGVLALVVLLLVLGGVVYTFVLNQPEQDSGLIVPIPETTGTASADTTIVVRPARSLAQTFAFRNIFEPSQTPPKTGSAVPTGGTTGSTGGTTGGATTTGTTTDGTAQEVPANTLFLTAVGTVDGQPVATFRWNDTVFIVSAGQDLQGTPWRLVSVEGNTTVLLYGDTRVSLTLGQGITK